jgi:hypothetical protein
MLSALVHHKGNMLDVGKGFFTLAADMGRLDPKGRRRDALVVPRPRD